MIGRAERICSQVRFGCYRLNNGKEVPFFIKVTVKVVIVIVKFFFEFPSIVCTRDAHQLYQILPSAPSDEILLMVFIDTEAAINPRNSGGTLSDGKGRTVVMNTSIVATSVSNAGIGLAVPMDWFKQDV